METFLFVLIYLHDHLQFQQFQEGLNINDSSSHATSNQATYHFVPRNLWLQVIRALHSYRGDLIESTVTSNSIEFVSLTWKTDHARLSLRTSSTRKARLNRINPKYLFIEKKTVLTKPRRPNAPGKPGRPGKPGSPRGPEIYN